MTCRTVASAPAPSARAAWNRCSGIERIAEVKMIIPMDAPMKPLAMTMSRTGALLRMSTGSSPAARRTWFMSPRSAGSTTHSHISA